MIQDVAQLGLKGRTITPGTVNIVLPPSRYDAILTILGDPNLVTGNIKYGATIFNVAGKASVMDTSDATATAANIRNVGGANNTSAYVNGVKEIGTMPDNATSTATITTQGGQVVVPAGYSPVSTITATLPTSTPSLPQTITTQGGQVSVSAGYTAGGTITATLPSVAASSLGPGSVIATGEYVTAGTVAYQGHNYQTFTSGGTFTVPAGVNEIYALIAGGGGGGGGGSEASGGGAGASALVSIAVTPAQVYTVAIGAAGTAGNESAGGYGGQSSITGNGVTITAGGGHGGVQSNGAGGVAGTVSNTGGTTIISNMSAGGAGHTASPYEVGGCGGSGMLGAGGANAYGNDTAAAGSGYGAGGSGSCNTAAGGAGTAGAVIFTW
jgi:hypothetical protein